MSAPDRIATLRGQNLVTGIDFVYVYPDQRKLDIYFLTLPPVASTLLGGIAAADILIYSPQSNLPVIGIQSITGWSVVNNQDVLTVVTAQTGDFSLYRLKIKNFPVDQFFNDTSFSFKANCPSDLDCKTPPHECPPDEAVDFPINYLARDFWSYRRALLDFASLRYPDWTDRLEADAGVMMAELFSAVGDEMAYYQDRVNREAYLESATQRRSIRRHARLIDYQMHDGLGASAWLDMTTSAPALIAAGTNVIAVGDDSARIDFEIGRGIRETLAGKAYAVNPAINSLKVHQWDENDKCLAAGSTELFIDGHHAADLKPGDATGEDIPVKWIILQTNPVDAGQPVRTQLVRLITVEDTRDDVFAQNITRLVWDDRDALLHEMDLDSLSVHGNIIPATAGITKTAYFIVGKDPGSNLPAAGTVNRVGHDNTNTHLFTLPGSQSQALVHLSVVKSQLNYPEIVLEEVDYVPVTNSWSPKPVPERWEYKHTLVGVESSGPFDKHFTLEDGSWQRVVGYQRIGNEIVHEDYASNSGVTIRFGDNEFGRTPLEGTAFMVRYRLGGGRRSNVASDTIKKLDPVIAGISVTNPIATTGGLDPESYEELRQLATDEFKAITYRAVRPEDYAEAAERLPWVQKAGAAFRWTGSWLTAFVTPDPKGKVILDDSDRKRLMDQLNRFRQAGREVNVLDPQYANIDLEIEICVSPSAYPGQVKQRVYDALMGKKGLRPVEGYFSPDRFTFGTLLDRSSLEAAIQDVPGVKAVEQIVFRRRGWFKWREFTAYSYDPGMNSIIRVANDPLHPERGTVKIHTHGGL
jgi:hypothetical protein